MTKIPVAPESRKGSKRYQSVTTVVLICLAALVGTTEALPSANGEFVAKTPLFPPTKTPTNTPTFRAIGPTGVQGNPTRRPPTSTPTITPFGIFNPTWQPTNTRTKTPTKTPIIFVKPTYTPTKRATPNEVDSQIQCDNDEDCGEGSRCVAAEPPFSDVSVCISEDSPADKTQTPPTEETTTPSPTQTSTPTATPIPADCFGDCDGNGIVSIGELIRLVAMALGDAEVTCASLQPGAKVSIADLIHAVSNNLDGCAP